jgi:hypothetical protein
MRRGTIEWDAWSSDSDAYGWEVIRRWIMGNDPYLENKGSGSTIRIPPSNSLSIRLPPKSWRLTQPLRSDDRSHPVALRSE